MAQLRFFRTATVAGAMLMAATAAASQLQIPNLAARDAAMSGNVVAVPSDTGNMLLINPAGVVERHGTQATLSYTIVNMSARYRNSEIGYDQKSSENPMLPVASVTSDWLSPWFVGAGLYGSVGTAYNFASDPSAGVTSQLLGESSFIHLGLVGGREIVPGLYFGVQIAPTYGYIKTRSPSPVGNVSFKIDGPGIVGATGVIYELTEKTTVGLSYRTPGVVFLDGDGDVGDAPEEVSIDFHIPQRITFGFAHRFAEGLTVTAQANWTDYPDLQNGEYEFENYPVLDQKFVARARSVFRYGLGLEYAVHDSLWLRAGISREPWAIDDSALRPILFDNTGTSMSAGLGISHNRWTIDVATGTVFVEDRLVTADEQPYFPGRYQSESGVGASVTVTYQFGAPPDSQATAL